MKISQRMRSVTGHGLWPWIATSLLVLIAGAVPIALKLVFFSDDRPRPCFDEVLARPIPDYGTAQRSTCSHTEHVLDANVDLASFVCRCPKA